MGTALSRCRPHWRHMEQGIYMGMNIEEDWEYYVPDPEIDELVHGVQLSGLAAFGDVVGRAAKQKGINQGLRVGKGNPDTYYPYKYGREKRSRAEKEELPERQCLSCQTTFVPKYKNNRYCSRACNPGPTPSLIRSCRTCGNQFNVDVGSKKRFCSKACFIIPRIQKTCLTCKCKFKSKRREQLYCSRKCRPTFTLLQQCKMNRFKECYERGDKVNDILKLLKISTTTVVKWKKILKIKSRSLGGQVNQTKVIKRKKRPINCCGCGVSFIPRRKSNKACSLKCRPPKPRMEPRQCLMCSATFQPNHYRQKLCTAVCHKKWRQRKAPCVVCKKECSQSTKYTPACGVKCRAIYITRGKDNDGQCEITSSGEVDA